MAKSTTTKKASAKKKSATKKTTAKKHAPKKKSAARKEVPRKWSRRVNETSNAMDLEEGVFKNRNPEKIAKSLKQSATKSKRKKASPFQSAMSMLNFYINRGGKNLSASQKKILEEAKDVLRELFDKEKK
jgi:hypothetical protein